MTIMAFVAEREGIRFEGARFSAEKVMETSPRRVGKIVLDLHLPRGLTETQKKKLQAAAETCPVKQSLHPAVETQIRYHWGS